MRRAIFWLGWAILFVLPVIFAVQVWMAQNLPPVEPWKWAVPVLALMLIYFGRSKDDILKHHLT